MKYYEVIIGVQRHWESAVFTYSHEENIPIQSIVRVPFGNKKKLGVVQKVVPKPSFNTKNILNVYGFQLPAATTHFIGWYTSFYAASPGQTYTQFLPAYLTAKQPKLIEKEIAIKPIVLPSVTDEQETALIKLRTDDKPAILHGITGAGKTRIYTHLILETLKKGRSALLLYPEISLTPQIRLELEKYAPVIVFHSQLTDAARSKLWYKIALADTPLIVIGPRSALFLPYKDLGVVIVDEAHEPAYKQDNDIRYSGLHVAAGLVSAHKAKLVIGSATPPITETEQILNKKGQLVCLHTRPLVEQTPKQISFVDARHRELFTHHQLVSDQLYAEILQTLDRKQQTLLFINRRGTAKLLLCGSPTCDWQARCENCDLPMTFHHDIHKLLCHTCGAKQAVPVSCPVCDSRIEIRSLGSKALEDDIAKLFPNAKIARFDTDTKKDASLSENYTSIRNGDVDILIGTQQLTKGLDLPKLATVGVLHADLSLHFPDYSSDERTFQLIAQVMGRVGRGHTAGTVILQTFQPNNPVLKLAAKEDWHGFRKLQLEERSKHHFPPYAFYLKIIFREKTYNLAISNANKFRASLTQKALHIDGPMPSFYAKRNNYHFTQIIVRSSSRKNLLAVARNIPKGALVDFDPIDLL